ncbi:MAG: transcriptional repressor LexA [Gammaproteobacteria bacterium]
MATNFRDKLYKYISNYANQQGGSPTFAEMTEAMGISPRSKSLITRSLRILAKEGKVTLTKQGRQLVIALSTKQLYLLGRISAGTPIEAITQHQPIDINTLFQGDNRFALQVKGDSMMDEGIFDGDFIICKPRAEASEGEIVIALIDQHNTTLKRISYKTRGMITLIPANTKLEPRMYHPERIQIQGIYVGLIRLSG